MVTKLGNPVQSYASARRIFLICPASSRKVTLVGLSATLYTKMHSPGERNVLWKVIGLSVAAEGVETGAQADALIALGCVRQQGHLYAPALSADAFETFLVERLAEGYAVHDVLAPAWDAIAQTWDAGETDEGSGS